MQTAADSHEKLSTDKPAEDFYYKAGIGYAMCLSSWLPDMDMLCSVWSVDQF